MTVSYRWGIVSVSLIHPSLIEVALAKKKCPLLAESRHWAVSHSENRYGCLPVRLFFVTLSRVDSSASEFSKLFGNLGDAKQF